LPGAELRLIRRRIRSVQSTMKITRAMELIAASRIVRAQQRVGAGQPYIAKMREVVANVSQVASVSHPLLAARPLATAGVLVVASDRGLAGAYNSNVIRLAEVRLQEHAAAGVACRVYVVGKRTLSYFRYRGHHIERSFVGITDAPTYEHARKVAEVLIDDYGSGVVDSVEAFSTRYLSAMTQTAAMLPLLPVSPPSSREGSAAVGYSYEPGPADILARLLPSYVEGAVFGILIDSSASEHAARRRAMKAATANAEELTQLLTRRANRARQAEITTEISEIVGGAEALTRG
jgi:F-type H+-transporting ATPase subunit gamma